MLTVIFFIIYTLFAAVGLSEICKLLIINLFNARGDNSMYMVVPIKGHNEKAEYILRSACSKIKWINALRGQKLICLNYNMDEETKKICEKVAKQHNIIEIMDINQFNLMISDK